MFENRKKVRPLRQNWQPHWILQLIQKLIAAAFAVVKVAMGALATVLIICSVCALVFVGTLGDYLQDDIVPMAGTDLGDFVLDQNSYMYYVDDGEIKLLQNIYATADSEWADYEDIPQILIDATVAIEDKRFFEHQGVDWVTTIKACARMFFGDASKGGSTITQQLIKNVYQEDSVTVQRKVLEIFRATQLEKQYDKSVILEYYLNWIYMGERCNGVKAAAAKYFGKELESLTVAECASLISITNNPSLYNPYRETLDAGGKNGAERNRKRQLDTLSEMKNQGKLTEEAYEEAVAQEMIFKSGIALEDKMVSCKTEGCGYRATVKTLDKKDGVYYCPSCGKKVEVGGDASEVVYSWFVDAALEDVAQDLARKNGVTEWNKEIRKQYVELIQRSGYHIYTTLDMHVQETLDSIYEDLSKIPATRSGQQLESGMVIVDNSTGYIVALAGGVGKKDTFDAYSCATDAKLQTGSSIKPLSIYAPGFEDGSITPATVVKDLPLQYSGSGKKMTAWPKNDTKTYSYTRTILSAVEDSVNGVAARTLDNIGVNYAFKFAKDLFGLSTLTESVVIGGETKSDIDLAPLAMGAQTIGITVRDMACAYATFANDGIYREGITYTKVYDSDGKLVLDNTQDSWEVLSRKTVDYMNYCLDVAVATGTGKPADISGQHVYGKTGSTMSNRDRWFCGYTGYYTAAVWCGYRQPEEIVLVGNTKNPAARLFKMVMEPLHKGLQKVSLVTKNKMKELNVCLDSGMLATEACGLDVRTTSEFTRVAETAVYKEDMLKDPCTKHVIVEQCTEGQACANEYCRLFAEVQQATLNQKALVKMTQLELDELLKAEKFKLKEEYLNDSYIYLVDANGLDANFKGLKGDKNIGVSAPYVVCTVHTQQAWESYLASLTPVLPTDPVLPSDPTVPAEPGVLGGA